MALSPLQTLYPFLSNIQETSGSLCLSLCLIVSPCSPWDLSEPFTEVDIPCKQGSEYAEAMMTGMSISHVIRTRPDTTGYPASHSFTGATDRNCEAYI